MSSLERNILEINELSVTFQEGKTPVFRDLSVQIPSGKIFGFFGETGCGKTTLAKCIAGFIPSKHVQGQITLHHNNSSLVLSNKDESYFRQNVWGKLLTYTPQDPYKTLNPYEIILSQWERCQTSQGKKIEEILQELDISAELLQKFPHELSAGQKQRCILGMTLLTAPLIMIFDEPTASVDRRGREIIKNCLKSLAQSGHTVIIISHETNDYKDLIPPKQGFYFSPPKTGQEFSPTIFFPERKSFIEIKGLSKSFAQNKILKEASFSIRKGQWVYLEGVNGSGKSTLLHIMMGLLSPDKGEILWQGEKIIPHERKNQHWIHPVFQDPLGALNPRMTVEASLLEVIQSQPKQKESLLTFQKEAWSILELSHDLALRYPQELSYGQQKRFVILRCLLKYYSETLLCPQAQHIFLFDEIFSGIHWALRRSIILFLQNLHEKQQNFAVLWIAHGYEELKLCCQGGLYQLEQGEVQVQTVQRE